MLQRRDALSEQEIFKLSKIIQLRLIQSPKFQSAQSIGAYHSFGSEVMTDAIISEAFELGKRISLPRVEGDKIEFYGFSENRQLVKNRFGILEPLPHEKVGHHDLLIVPGIAFDKDGYRVGYGKGYYDRHLAQTDAFSVGLAYSFQIIDRMPRQMHDKKVSAVATEEKLIIFHA